MVGIWLASELFWNSQSVKLEVKGENNFFYIWIASILFFLVNSFIVLRFIWNHKVTSFQLATRKPEEHSAEQKLK